MLTRLDYTDIDDVVTVYAFYADGSELAVELDEYVIEWLEQQFERPINREGGRFFHATLGSALYQMNVDF